jgi:hypothetical protein
MAAVAETQVTGRETAVKLDAQTAQLQTMSDTLAEIDTNVGRSKKIILRMARKVTTDRYVWVVIFFVVAAIVFIIVWVHMRAHAVMRVDTHTQTHIQTYTHIHIHTPTHTHTHTHT